MKKSTISKKFPMQMVFFCLLFTKTIFSEKEIHGIIERGRMGSIGSLVLKVTKSIKNK